MPWMTTPTYHSQLGNTIGTLTDHSNEPESDGIYKRSPGWPPQQTRVRWGIQKESWLQGCSKKKQLKKATQIFVKKSNFFSAFLAFLVFFGYFECFWLILFTLFFSWSSLFIKQVSLDIKIIYTHLIEVDIKNIDLSQIMCNYYMCDDHI